MKTKKLLRYIPLLLLVVVLAGCVGPLARGGAAGDRQSAAAMQTPAITAPAAAAPTAATAAATDDVAAIKDVIQQANDAQPQALARRDPTLMRATATADYYDQLVQTQRDLENGGVASITLINLEWGPVQVDGTSAQATTTETWRTTFSDGSTEQDRARNVYTLVQQNGVWVIQADDHPDSRLDQPPAGSGASPGATAPPSGSAAPAPGSGPGSASAVPAPPAAPISRSDTSNNWSGYAATGGTFTAVSGTWTAPQVTADAGGAGDASWVGIGGADTRDLIQAGTEATVLGPGQVRYSAWIETLPQASQTVPLVVNPGDTVSVSITQQEGDNWLITLDNQTTGGHYQTTVRYASSRSSAEWIEEAPSGGRRTLPLDNFGTVQFRDGSAVENGQRVTIAQAGARPITMIDRGGQPIASASALAGDGAGFSVSRVASAAPVAPGFGRSRTRVGRSG